jgi:hypothetical protein
MISSGGNMRKRNEEASNVEHSTPNIEWLGECGLIVCSVLNVERSLL